jgi:hypothetical protein
MSKHKHKCECGKLAVYFYMPVTEHGDNHYYCEDCVPVNEEIGCSCNWHYCKDGEQPIGVENVDWKWVVKEADEHISEITKDEKIFINLNEDKKPYPCSEFDYSSDGYFVDTWLDKLSFKIYSEIFWFKRKLKKYLYTKNNKNLFKFL